MPKFAAIKYETDSGKVYTVKGDPATIDSDKNPEAAAAVSDSRIVVYASGSRRNAALRARKIRLKRLVGTVGGVDVYKYRYIVVYRPSSVVNFPLGATVAVGSTNWTVAGLLVPEG